MVLYWNCKIFYMAQGIDLWGSFQWKQAELSGIFYIFFFMLHFLAFETIHENHKSSSSFYVHQTGQFSIFFVVSLRKANISQLKILSSLTFFVNRKFAFYFLTIVRSQKVHQSVYDTQHAEFI
jgi:hypothetical protein